MLVNPMLLWTSDFWAQAPTGKYADTKHPLLKYGEAKGECTATLS